MKKKLKKLTKAQLKKPKTTQEEESEEKEKFDFGGIPKTVDFKRNIGCGG